MSADERLRQAGFTIYCRIDGYEAVWKRDGKHYTESQALELVEKDDAGRGAAD